jgi:acyl carrier protein
VNPLDRGVSALSIPDEVEQFIVKDIAAGRGIDSIEHDSDMLAGGVIDSLGINELIGFLERAYGIRVADDDIDAENFRSIENIAAFVERKRG